MFWKTIKPFFTNKGSSESNIKLVEKDEILQDDKEIAEELNTFFKNSVSTFDINENSSIINQNFQNFDDPLDRAIEMYKYHLSIILINHKIGNPYRFSFEPVALSDVVKEINDINRNKSSSKDSIPSKILKISSESTANILQKLLNDSLETRTFPDSLKLADITPVFKNKDPLNKTNYCPVSVLPIVSKLFEKIMQKQINGFISNCLSPYLCGDMKGYNTQQALLALIEKWKKNLDDKGYGGAVLMDLPKAFDTLNNGLLKVKLSAYSFEHDALKLIYSYQTNRWHGTKIKSAFSSWEDLTQGVPQGFVLGPLLFINDLFYLSECTEVSKFADDTTFTLAIKIFALINRLEHDSFLAIEWFENNHVKLNQ